MTASGMPEDVEREFADMERQVRWLVAQTNGPGPLVALQHDVLVTACNYRQVRDRYVGSYVPRRSGPGR